MTLIVRDVGGKNKRRVNVPWEGLATTAQWVEQAGNGGKDFSVGRTSWEGWQAESGTPRLSSSERAPAESTYEILFETSER